MAFTKQIDDKEWHKIGDKLTTYLGICGCQRKLKSIIDVLVTICGFAFGFLPYPNAQF